MLTGAMIGYLIIHPGVMILAHLMLRSKMNPGATVGEIILSELTKTFSWSMMAWGISFALICAITALVIGRNFKISSQLRESERRYRKLSITDDLTRLYNSRHFFKQLEAEIERTNRYGHPLTLLILDLDNFKRYNDTYGHIEGDGILSILGHTLLLSLRKTDTAYRYGGEEFAVILPESSGKESLHFADRIRQAFEKNSTPAQAGECPAVTVSIGLAQYIPGEDLTTFIKRADKNMYTAKKAGKNRIHYQQEYEN
jgi:diguanylate cyclase (GGDEF)-like protein